jgi:hypothetical protein
VKRHLSSGLFAIGAGALQNRASRLGKIRPNFKRLCSLCERKFGHAMVVPFPPQVLHLPLPDLPVPKHCAHQDTRSSEPHFEHRLPSFATLLITVALWPLRLPLAQGRRPSM